MIDLSLPPDLDCLSWHSTQEDTKRESWFPVRVNAHANKVLGFDCIKIVPTGAAQATHDVFPKLIFFRPWPLHCDGIPQKFVKVYETNIYSLSGNRGKA
ncbi:uncharacterized protein FOMMEDRAFT_136421 [Fomitiporia mediterranea MF3/22]|uniref:uncharacterized protein n=1 Tax=Fomitiporia mediterranea (strain MF3/22) TaxID=694068 RepID=UPI0004407477|nr:uncharacterized protein FOMMEDRAFT_136421 [Fomitiporia mediterranea MF3/22]EJC99798.1 hypothetical protein FOMMEDRAFT_136421 [Fomitiporia mediterranea MF3/22]